VIRTPYIDKVGTRAGFLMKRALRHPRLKHYARMYYSVKSIFELRRASLQGVSYKDFFQAGKSVAGIENIESAGPPTRSAPPPPPRVPGRRRSAVHDLEQQLLAARRVLQRRHHAQRERE